jgi:L-rhamnose isomerase
MDIIQSAYKIARERYGALGVDTETVLARLEPISISLQCWQGDDVAGFENPEGELTGGIAATGNNPGRASNATELRQDLDEVYRLLPGIHRLNLHASYLESDRKVERNKIEPCHFSGWVDWAKENRHGLDFNPTVFRIPWPRTVSPCPTTILPSVNSGWNTVLPAAGLVSLSDVNSARQRSPTSGSRTGTKIHPLTGPHPAGVYWDHLTPSWRRRSTRATTWMRWNRNSSESMEFYLAYAVSRKILLTLDSGHFHPTESIADKISALLLYLDQLLLHVSRGVRWDSDHVVTFTEDLQAIVREIVRGDALERVHIGLDYFDASINRVAAWTIGARNTLRALLAVLLEPADRLATFELEGDFTSRLALQEELKSMPVGAVWDAYCTRKGVPIGMDFLMEIKEYEQRVLARRS